MKITKYRLIVALLAVLLFSHLATAKTRSDIQQSPDYWCPKIEFVGRAAEIFNLKKCEYVSGITIKLIYNGKYSYPEKLKVTLLDAQGNTMPEDSKKKVFGPRHLKKGQYGIFTIQNYGNENPAKISIQGIWKTRM